MRAAVVGGGFWGLSMALALARRGARVWLFEEHGRVGRPEHCTGLVSRRVVEYLGWPVASSVVAWYPRFRVCAGGACAELEAEGGVYKLDRRLVEERLLEAAVSEGVEALLGVRVSRVEADGSLAAGRGPGRFDLVVLAEGALGRLRAGLGIGYRGPLVYGVNAVYEAPCGWEGGFTALFHREARGLFSWSVPLPGGLCVVGTGSGDPGSLAAALGAAEARLLSGRGARARAYGGPLPLGGPARRLRAGRVVVAGDAAGLVKPLTGGGLWPAAEAYRALAEGDGGPPGPREVEAAVAGVARVLARQARLGGLLRGDPGVVECAVRALAGAGRLGPVDYDMHHGLPLRVLRASPGAVARAAARCPGALARGAAALLAGLLGL